MHAHAASSSSSCLSHPLAGSPVFEAADRTVVPLLHPALHSLPFAMALELRQPGAPPAVMPPLRSRDIYELHFVLAGAGLLRQHDGREETLHAGDTVLMTLGAATCAAAGPHRRAPPAEGLSWNSGRDLASFVVYMPRALVDAAAKGNHDSSDANAAFGSNAIHQQIVQLVDDAWGPANSSSTASEARLPQHVVDAVLSGARDLATRVAEGSDSDADIVEDPGQGEDGGWMGWARAMAAAAAAARLLLHRGEAPVKRTLQDLTSFRMPNQTNRLALVFDPMAEPQVPFVFGVEIFEPGHRTTPHVHPGAHELFAILSGEGHAFCGEHRFPVAAGDVVVFRPGSTHGIDSGGAGRMYCLELMLPDEAFAALVRSGQPSGGLRDEDLCLLARVGCA